MLSTTRGMRGEGGMRIEEARFGVGPSDHVARALAGAAVDAELARARTRRRWRRVEAFLDGDGELAEDGGRRVGRAAPARGLVVGDGDERGPFERAEHVAHRDLFGGAGQVIAAARAALRAMRPAFFRSWKICSRKRAGISSRSAISRICVGRPLLWKAMSNIALTP
jgi:hypothetical protein